MLDYEEAIVWISKVVLSRQGFISLAKLLVPVFSLDVLCCFFYNNYGVFCVLKGSAGCLLATH